MPRKKKIPGEELPYIEKQPRGGKTNDFNKIRILRVLENHRFGCQQKNFRKPPGGNEIPKYLECIRDLMEDEFIKVDHEDEEGELIIIITAKGKRFLKSLKRFKESNPGKFYFYSIFVEDTRFPAEKRISQFTEGVDR